MKALACVFALLLLGCAARPPAPAWQADAHGALQAAVAASLEGRARVAEAEMARARQALGATGQPALLARAELVLCAAQVASLDFGGCPHYQALAVDAEPAEQAYATYLYGEVDAAQRQLLPATQRQAALPADPLARLVAAAVRQRQGRASAADVADAVDTASGQGWRRPLLAWLGLQLRAAEAAGDAAAAARLRRRMALAG